MTPLRSLFAALLLPLCATAAHAQDWKEIRFGVFPEYPPFESVAADGSLQGFDIELGNAICAKLEVKCTWVHNEFDGMIPALRARKFDAIMSSMASRQKGGNLSAGIPASVLASLARRRPLSIRSSPGSPASPCRCCR